MSDKRMIIRNCPVAFNTRVDGTYCNDVEITNGKNIHCQYITDCVLKKIVELCKENLNSLETYVDVRSLECVTLQNILKLLDIQESGGK